MSASTLRSGASMPAVVLDGVFLTWPDGTSALAGVSVTFPAGRTGLIGPNGCGKSTLLRVVAGDLVPDAGTVHVAGDVRYLRQDAAVAPDATVADLLGITPRRRALAAITGGSVDPADFDAVGDDWAVEERALAELALLGLDGDHDLLDRAAVELSGGEAMQVALTGIRLARPAVTLLDEPTNNLDAVARARLYAAVDAWPGALVVVTHDRELLEHVDAVADLGRPGVPVYGGTFSAYAEPAPQLLVLDEPTNNLDMASVDQLVSALEDYRGALLVVTHDDHLARALRVDRTWVVERPGGAAAVVRDETLEAPAGRSGAGASRG